MTSGDNDVAITAVTNVIAALGATLMTTDPSHRAIRTFLSMLDSMNDGLIPPGPALDKLKAATRLQANMLEQVAKS